MLSAGGSARLDPTLRVSSSRLLSATYPPVTELFSRNATHLSCTNHQRNRFRLCSQSMLKAHGRFRFHSFTPHLKTFKRLLLTVAESEAKVWTSRVGTAINKSSNDRLLQVVLYSPQIPGNTGCIARTCAASAVGLHLVEPLGFQIDDTKLKRAGLDYWPYVVVKVHSSWGEFIEYFKQQEGEKRLLAFTKKGTSLHTDIGYKAGDWLVFGSEPSGLSAEALNDCTNEIYGGGTVRIPILETYVRCLNLSVSVGIAIYEASRQLNIQPAQHNHELIVISETMSTAISNLSSYHSRSADVTTLENEDCSSVNAASVGSNTYSQDGMSIAAHNCPTLVGEMTSLAATVATRCASIFATIAITPLYMHRVGDEDLLTMYNLLETIDTTYLKLERMKTTLREIAYEQHDNGDRAPQFDAKFKQYLCDL